VARACGRRDWLDAGIEPLVDSLPLDQRMRLDDEWLRAGQMEHASIAAFARFTLQLLSLGAPADLVEASSRAMADETAHARICFALASRYQGHELGPGPLSIDGSLDQESLAEVVVLAIREGCVGETVAAVYAAEAAEHATDPVVRAALRRIHADEARHAELAWRFVRWAIVMFGPELLEVVKAEFSRIAVEPSVQTSPASDHELLDHGVLPEAVRHALRAEVLTRVVEPCARAVWRSGSHEQAVLPVIQPHRLT